MPLAPLTTPKKQLSTQEQLRYGRHFTLPGIGEEGQRRLANAKVLSIGAGGLGSPLLLYLSAAGVGTLGIIDHDTVEYSNLQRQIIHNNNTINTPKTHSAQQRIHELNPHTNVHTYHEKLNADNAEYIIKNYDLIIDGSDNFATKYLTNDICEHLNKPLIWGSISQYTAQISLFWAHPKHLNTTQHTQGTTLRDLYPQIPAADSIPTCAQSGVLGSLCGTIGSIMATEAIKLITGVPEPLLGKLWMYNSRTHTTKTLNITPDPHRTPTPLTETLQQIQQSTPQPLNVPEITLHEINQHPEHYTLIDVREHHERNNGHYQDHAHIPHQELLTLINNTPNPLENINNTLTKHLKNNTTPVFYCASGKRSALIVHTLKKQQPHITALSLTGGFNQTPIK